MRRLRLATLIAVAAATALLAGCGSSTNGDAGVPASSASTSATTMDAVVAAHAAASPSTFAKNVTEIAVAPGDPAKITTLADRAKPGVNAATSYPIATLTASKNPDLAKAFVDYVLSADGAGVLTAAGFREP